MSEILSASVASDPAGQISVVFTLTDGSGVPLTPTLTSTQDPQQARVRFTIAQLEEYSGGGELGNTFYRYVNDIDATSPSYDSGGTLEVVDAATGTYRYIFNTTLPADYDPSLTYTVGEQVDRTYQGVQLGANPVFDFIPAGGTPFVWEDVTTDECNSCHQPLTAHGNRHEVRLCKLCHTEAATDPKGTSIDFRVMIHMIHAGKELPSVVDGPPGSFYGIYSDRSMSYAIFSEKLDDGSVIGVGFPRYLEECLPCHAEGPTADFYARNPRPRPVRPVTTTSTPRCRRPLPARRGPTIHPAATPTASAAPAMPRRRIRSSTFRCPARTPCRIARRSSKASTSTS